MGRSGDGLLKSWSQFLEYMKQREGRCGDTNERDFSTVPPTGGGGGMHLIPSRALTFKVCYLHVPKNTLPSSGFRLSTGHPKNGHSLSTNFLSTLAAWEPHGGRCVKTKTEPTAEPVPSVPLPETQEFGWMLCRGVGRVFRQPAQS